MKLDTTRLDDEGPKVATVRSLPLLTGCSLPLLTGCFPTHIYTDRYHWMPPYWLAAGKDTKDTTAALRRQYRRVMLGRQIRGTMPYYNNLDSPF